MHLWHLVYRIIEYTLLVYRFLSASKRFIRSSRLGAEGTPSAILLELLDCGFGSEGLRGGIVFSGSLMVGCGFSVDGLGGAIAMGSRRVLSPVDSSASRGGSKAAIPPPPSSEDILSTSAPHSILYVLAISRRYRVTRVAEGGSTASLFRTRGDTLLSELSIAVCANGRPKRIISRFRTLH